MTTTNDCSGCQHIQSDNKTGCYMFEKKPDVLPCGQHDMFKEEREMTAKMILKNPLILVSMIEEIKKGKGIFDDI